MQTETETETETTHCRAQSWPSVLLGEGAEDVANDQAVMSCICQVNTHRMARRVNQRPVVDNIHRLASSEKVAKRGTNRTSSQVGNRADAMEGKDTAHKSATKAQQSGHVGHKTSPPPSGQAGNRQTCKACSEGGRTCGIQGQRASRLAGSCRPDRASGGSWG